MWKILVTPPPRYWKDGFSLTFFIKLFMDWVRPPPIFHKIGELFSDDFFEDLARNVSLFLKFSINFFHQIFHKMLQKKLINPKIDY